MTIRFRRTVKVAPGVRLNVTKSGLGVRFGPRGLGLSAHSSGKVTASAGIPGSGLYYRKERKVVRPHTQLRARHGVPELPEGRDLRQLRRAAWRDFRQGGGPALERVYQLAAETFSRGAGEMGAEMAVRAVSRLDSDERRSVAALLATSMPAGTSPDAVAELYFEQTASGPAQDPASVRRDKQLSNLLDLSSMQQLADECFVAADRFLDGMPFDAEWLEERERDAVHRAMHVMIDELCTVVLADELAAELDDRDADSAIADVVGAYRLLSHGSPSAVEQAVALARRAAATPSWPTTDRRVTLTLGDHLHIELPVDGTAVACALLRAAHLLGEPADARRADLDRWSTVEMLVAVHDWWLDGATGQLSELDAPEPTDDVSALVCVYLAAGIAEDRPGDALELLDAAAAAPGSIPIRAEALLHRAWVRRAVGDTRYEQDVAAVQEMQPEHPGLWALPDLDRPADVDSDAEQVAYETAAEVYAATFPHWVADDVHRHARSLVANVIGRVIVADGQLSLHEEQLWGSPALVSEVAGMTQATDRHSPEHLATDAVGAGVDQALLYRFAEAVIALARHAALIDGEVDPDERDMVSQLHRQLRGAVASTTNSPQLAAGGEAVGLIGLAADLVVNTGLASATLVARKLNVHIEVAGQLMAELQRLGAVGPSRQVGVPEVLWRPEDLQAARDAGLV